MIKEILKAPIHGYVSQIDNDHLRTCNIKHEKQDRQDDQNMQHVWTQNYTVEERCEGDKEYQRFLILDLEFHPDAHRGQLHI
jgi:hypothetical protein